MAQLERDGTQNSLLEVEHLCEDEAVADLNFEVTIKIRRNKLYEGRKLIFLSIFDRNHKPNNIRAMISFSRRSFSNSIQIPNIEAIF